MTEPVPTQLAEHLSGLLSATPADRPEHLLQMIKSFSGPGAFVVIADRLLSAGPEQHTLFLQWFVGTPGPLPDAILARAVPVLGDRRVAIRLRLTAAARILGQVPDRVRSVRPVARAIVRGLSPGRALTRLRQLQNRLDGCATLDTLIDRREARLKMDCPRCDSRLPRPAMIVHLWESHGLMLENSQIRSVARWNRDLEAEFLRSRNPDILETATALLGPEGLRGWFGSPQQRPEESLAVRTAAAERGDGLCPSCGRELAPVVSPLPPELNLSERRLSGEGYAISTGGAQWPWFYEVTTPERLRRKPRDWRHQFTARTRGTFALLGGGLIAWMISMILPAGPELLGVWASVVSASIIGYLLMLRGGDSNGHPADHLLDAAWTYLGKRLVDRGHGVVFLTRLCRSSFACGDPEVRARMVNDLVRLAADADPATMETGQLLACSRLLQVMDDARFGRDRGAGIAELVAEGFRSDLPASFAEFVAEAYLKSEPRPSAEEQARVRVLLLAAAFDSGLRPIDLLDLWSSAPYLRQLMLIEPAHRLGMFHGVFQTRMEAPWTAIAPSRTVFELALSSPVLSGQHLTRFPDALLIVNPPQDVERVLGPIVVCCRGVSVGGHMVADPDAEVRQLKSGELIFGTARIPIGWPLPHGFLSQIRTWLHFRTNALLPFIDGYRTPGPPEVTARILAPFARVCPTCGVCSAIAVGKLGIILPAG